MAVLRVADRALVVGVTDAHVTLLGETDLDTVHAARDEAEHLEAERRALGPGGRSARAVPAVQGAVPAGP